MNPGCKQQDFRDWIYGSGDTSSPVERRLKNVVGMETVRYREGGLKIWHILSTMERYPSSHQKLVVLDDFGPLQIQLQSGILILTSRCLPLRTFVQQRVLALVPTSTPSSNDPALSSHENAMQAEIQALSTAATPMHSSVVQHENPPIDPKKDTL